MDKYNVMIVEDQVMPRQLFEIFVTSSDRYALVASIADASKAIDYVRTNKIDLILMDVITKNGANGLTAAAEIKALYPHIRIIIVTSMPECSYLNRAREIGVDSFWYKEVSQSPILAVMDRTMAGEHLYPDTTPALMLGQASNYDFTDRETDVLREMTAGLMNEEIAAKLSISVNTVKKHIQSMIEKTGFKNRTELAVEAMKTGFVIPQKTPKDV